MDGKALRFASKVLLRIAHPRHCLQPFLVRIYWQIASLWKTFWAAADGGLLFVRVSLCRTLFETPVERLSAMPPRTAARSCIRGISQIARLAGVW